MQIFELPIDFYSETLQTIRVTDNRTTFIHSGLVSGITVPEPATIMMLGLGGLVLLRRRKIY
jgi:hypothetical protein